MKTVLVLEKIISGGQTGADRGALDAALGAGVPVGGWCPKGRRSEDGKIPTKYPLKETWTTGYLPRTVANVHDADGTLVFTLGPLTPGSRLTLKYAKQAKRSTLRVNFAKESPAMAADRVEAWLRLHPIRVLNVAGSRESKAPGIGALVAETLGLVLKEAQA